MWKSPVPDSAKSAAFTPSIFGIPIWKTTTKSNAPLHVKLGPCYIAIEQGREPLGVDHFSASIEGFQIANIHGYLDQRGIAYKDYLQAGKDLNVNDPDGIHLKQLSAENTWEPGGRRQWHRRNLLSPVPG